jgi:hypothetical protein
MASEIKVDTIVNAGGDNDSGIDLGTNDTVKVTIAGAEKARVDASGNLMVAKTSVASSSVGFEARANGFNAFTRDGGQPLEIRRLSSDGVLIDLRKDSTTVGSIGNASSDSIYIDGNASAVANLGFGGSSLIYPTVDNVADLGASSLRFDDIFATNGTIQTSDQNEKQDIASATAKELNVAKKLSALFKTFRWKDKVSEKGDKARTHTGIVAQEVQTAFKAEGLDASNYGLFTSDTWWEKEIKVDAVEADEEKGIEAKDAYTYMDTKDEKTDGYTEKTRLGVRYPELFSFIFSSIEARLTALESK